jgi:hypothetical protein
MQTTHDGYFDNYELIITFDLTYIYIDAIQAKIFSTTSAHQQEYEFFWWLSPKKVLQPRLGLKS